MTRPRDFYDVLGVERRSTQDDLKRAYRRLAHAYHPDKNPDDPEAEERFKEVTRAYEVLGDPGRRANYDRFGSAGGPFGAGTRPGGGAGFQDIFGDLFNDIFGGDGSKRAQPGADLSYKLEVTLEEASRGVERRIRVPRQRVCPACQGSGAREAAAVTSCPGCHGSGQIRQQQGFFSISKTCTQCAGKGKLVRDPCRRCHAVGTIRQSEELNVRVPAGVDTGSRLRLKGEGEASVGGGVPGDLYVVVEVKPHEHFERDGRDVIFDLVVSVPQAALGAEVEIPTLEGPVRMKVPAGTQPGRVYRLNGKGLPEVGGTARGDQHVRIQVQIPTRMSARQRELFEALSDLDEEAGRESRGILDRVKDLFE